MLLKYKGILSVQSSKNETYEIDMSNATYHIDSEGFLLDDQCYYILDLKDQRIRLPQEQVSRLKALCLN